MTIESLCPCSLKTLHSGLSRCSKSANGNGSFVCTMRSFFKNFIIYSVFGWEMSELGRGRRVREAQKGAKYKRQIMRPARSFFRRGAVNSSLVARRSSLAKKTACNACFSDCLLIRRAALGCHYLRYPNAKKDERNEWTGRS